jgi:hypothetical protein
MSVLSREAMLDTFDGSTTSDERRGVRARFSMPIESAIGAACLAAAFVVPEGYPRLVALALVSLCSYAWILRACHCE